MIIYGTFTETSVPKLFIAGIIPGLIMTALFMIYIAVHAKLVPSVAPKEAGARSFGAAIAALLEVVPFFILILVTLGGLYFGWTTTTEAAAIGCVLSILLGMTLGTLTWRGLVTAMHNTIYFSGNILFLILAAYIFSVALSFGGVGEKVTEFIVGLNLTKFEFYIALLILFTILGCLIESLGMIVITVPLLFPVLAKYDIDPILFGVILVIYVELGQISPPIGINLFVIQSIWDGKLSEVVLGTIPFHLIMFVVLGMVIYWPELALWLPATMSGK
jgi:tripartite ATP-independent transporter DctM subunit